ncbi:MAG TPA: 3-ketoacyl-ACP reductase [Blastocatellia bacterium]|nr:3-ketoacyl-ACP reductase [Blastocatellia bacterium]
MIDQTVRAPSNTAPVGLITGGSRGIGRGIAIALARLGFDLIINYRSDRQAADEAAKLAVAAAGREGARILTCKADISEAADREALVGFGQSQFSRLDLLVNNAGIGPQVRTDLLEASEESFERLMRVNLKGPYFLTQAIARWMIEQIKSGDTPAVGSARRAIINIGSISAYAASPDRGDYCVSKAGVSMMTALFAARLAEYGINVYEVRPGITRTDLTAPVTEKYDRLIAEGLTPIRRWGTPEDVGRAVAAVASGALPFSTGEVINVDGGFHLRRL